ncbi:class I adenylate-forming enzyme family protein [Rhodococcus pyridinivorans]|uniref:class I adenylate-forming enzyme family protein n=1 Tax=Rhodococcus pyridinivorans TaxID=103816 RepID=UPI002283E21B|nr:AMP-binding protein [Rhodococcus pyridinivorans]WAL49316.1 AMP-binding protein [Rhodococcus pyridinivorans]
MSVYDDRPWLAHYGGRPVNLRVEFSTAMDMFDAAVAAAPDAPAMHYFDETTSWLQLDRASDALAALLLARGFRPGDRCALYVQNNPAFVIGLVAAWKVGGIPTAVNPMSKVHELASFLSRYRPAALVALDDLYVDVVRPVLAIDTDLAVPVVVTTSALDGQSRKDPRVFAGLERLYPPDTIDLGALIARFEESAPRRHPVGPGDIAVLLATSGTTGSPKAARISHTNLTFNTQTYRDWTGVGPGDPILALAPVFQVTGLVGAVTLAMLLRSPLVLTHRIHPGVIAAAIRERHPVFAVAAITAYIALADESDITPDEMAPLRLRYSGGAPLESAVADRLETALGGYIHNIYGQTETTSPTHIVPPELRSPVDAETGAVSVGVPVSSTVVRVVDEDGRDLPAGEIGELVTSGPQVISAYWDDPEASAAALTGGELRTGDVGFMDAKGWFYVVDRSTDVINASGYKIWPYEVESVLTQRPDVVEAAVVGMADDYRGESAKAYVVLTPGSTTTETDLVEYCRERMAAYKYPREVELVGSLPRSATGKLLRRTLRN